MIVSFILYSIVVGAFVAVAAWLIERALGRLGCARRPVWIAAIAATLLLPLLATLLQDPVRPRAAPLENSAPPRIVLAGEIAGSLRAAPTLRDVRVANVSLDAAVAGLWIIASACLLALQTAGAWRLARRSQRWRSSTIASHAVSVAPDIGPALYGWWRPRIVFPAWLLGAPAATQTLALEHERAHLAVRDPQVLAAATLLISLLPWNLPMLWMLRRLRFAMEVDCDARVVRAGADASDYGLALLFVSERQSRSPFGTIALIERPSQLERRIRIMISSPRHRALVAGACIALASSCLFAAAQVAAPARVDDSPLKPAPGEGADMRLGRAFEQHILKRYAALLTEDVGGTPIVVALMNDDLTVVKSAQLLSDKKVDDIEADESMFESIGLTREEVPYIGAMGMQSPTDPARKLLVIYTEQLTPGKPFRANVGPDTRALDRQLFERNFPDAVKHGVPADARPWLLLDREGQVLLSGIGPLNPKDLSKQFERRFGGIKTREATLTPIVDDRSEPVKDLGGGDLQLFSIWLAPDSPPPR